MKNVFVRRMDKWSVRMPNAAWTKMLKCWKDVCRFLETMYVVRSTGCVPFLHKRQDLFDLRLWPLVLVVLRYVVLPESIQDVIFRITSVHLPSILKKLTNLDLEWVLCNVCTLLTYIRASEVFWFIPFIAIYWPSLLVLYNVNKVSKAIAVLVRR